MPNSAANVMVLTLAKMTGVWLNKKEFGLSIPTLNTWKESLASRDPCRQLIGAVEYLTELPRMMTTVET